MGEFFVDVDDVVVCDIDVDFVVFDVDFDVVVVCHSRRLKMVLKSARLAFVRILSSLKEKPNWRWYRADWNARPILLFLRRGGTDHLTFPRQMLPSLEGEMVTGIG